MPAILIDGKQRRISHPAPINVLPIDKSMAREVDRIWLHENGFWEMMTFGDMAQPLANRPAIMRFDTDHRFLLAYPPTFWTGRK